MKHPEHGDGVNVPGGALAAQPVEVDAFLPVLQRIRAATKKDAIGTAAAINYGAAMRIVSAIKAVNGNVEDKEKFFQTLRATEITSSPRGPIKIDKYGHIIQNVYFRRVDKVGNTYQNTVIDTYPSVSQFWKYNPEEYLKHPVRLHGRRAGPQAERPVRPRLTCGAAQRSCSPVAWASFSSPGSPRRAVVRSPIGSLPTPGAPRSSAGST